MILSLTRLRLASIRNLPGFLKISGASIEQATKDPNCLLGATYLGPGLTFWTATLWTDEAAMQSYVRSGAHREAMPYLGRWCSEAATRHVEILESRLPEKSEIRDLIAREPKFFKVQQPSRDHQEKVISPKSPWLFQQFKK
jgi:hypothetical protein